MIELDANALTFSFPEVHPHAAVRVDFQRTLRIPDDGKSYPLPPGLGRFPVRHVDDFAERVPRSWLRHGGVMLPVYRSEALWLNFTPLRGGLSKRGPWEDGVYHGTRGYPFALKVAAGKVDAVTGDEWRDALRRDPQDYLVVPGQPWLDGWCVEEGAIRQFVSMPLGSGYSAEEQLTGDAPHGGIQIIAYPMKAEAYERLLQKQRNRERARTELRQEDVAYSLACAPAGADMGLAPGGRMRQEIYDDPWGFDVWDTEHASRCFVHLANALVWRAIAGEDPPTTPPTAAEYTRHGLPWFEYYAADRKALEGSAKLGRLKSVVEMGEEQGEIPLPENEPVTPEKVVRLREGLRDGQVREGAF